MTKISLESREKHDTCVYFGLVGLAVFRSFNFWNVNQIFFEKIWSLSNSRLVKDDQIEKPYSLKFLEWNFSNIWFQDQFKVTWEVDIGGFIFRSFVKIWLTLCLEDIRERKTNQTFAWCIFIWKYVFPSDWKS